MKKEKEYTKEKCSGIGSIILLYFIFIGIISCNNIKLKEDNIQDETIAYARRWDLPDSIFIQSSFYRMEYDYYIDYCSRLFSFGEKCLENEGNGIRMGVTPSGVGIIGDLRLYSIQEVEGGIRLNLKEISLKDNTPLFVDDSTIVDKDSMMIEIICDTVIKNKGITDVFYEVLNKYNYFNEPPLDIIPGVKPVGFSVFFDMEFRSETKGYHRIHRSLNCDKDCAKMYNEILNLFNKYFPDTCLIQFNKY